jgi:hypothetical protein
MRKEFIECASYRTAKNHCPWAVMITRVDGGFMAFESLQDYKTWKGQK